MGNVTLRMEPITSAKPRVALDAAADVARRIGCDVAIEINGATVRIAPTTPKGTAFENWSAAKADTDAQLNGSVGDPHSMSDVR